MDNFKKIKKNIKFNHMKKINYTQILKDAWEVTWKNRYLWWFGLLIFLSGGGGMFSSSDSHKKEDYQQIMDFIQAHQQIIIIIGCVVFLIWLAFLILSFIGRGALIKSIQKNLEAKTSNFKSGFQDGKKYFWKVLSIGMLAALFVIAAMLIFIVPISLLFANEAFILGGIMILVAITVLIPVIFLISFSQTYGLLYAVMTNLGIWDSLEKGYELIIKNVGPSILMALIILAINIVIGILSFIAMILLAIPFAILGVLFFLLFKMAGAIFIGCLAIVAFIIFILLVGSVTKVFFQTIWILFFKEIAKAEEKEVVAEVEKEKEIKAAEITSVPV